MPNKDQLAKAILCCFHRLELRMAELDHEVLKELANILESGERHMWVFGMLALFLLLHREIDAGRNTFWRCYTKSVGFMASSLMFASVTEG